ncbi:MAG: methyl-accepting chemotaxis protein [Gammaproteobacteria bacterium]|nr:methyl-accepting chemotaxis protein [Gammaproteobacteria bacterium]
MAENSKNSSTFTVVTALLAILILAAAALMYLQPGKSDGGDARQLMLAALAQGIPLHASEAIAGGAAEFERLEADLNALRPLRGLTSGARQHWDQLTQGANAIVERRASLQAINSASSLVEQRMPGLLAAADNLLNESGPTALLQQFKQRTIALRRSLDDLRDSADPATVSADITANLAFLRQLVNALSGGGGEPNVTAMDAGVIESTLAPMAADLADIESQVAQALSGIAALNGLQTDIDAMKTAARVLYGAAFSKSSESSLHGLLAQPVIWFGMLGIAMVLLLALFRLHAKSAVFEKTARIQAEQNDRNQQAILRLLDELGSLADGDLTVEATVTEDITGAIADSINYAIEKLRELVATINETAIMVDSAAKQTESMATHLSKASVNQSSEIMAATESIVSMASSIEEVSGNAERSSDVARHSVDVAHKGGEAVRRTIDGMNTIRETIQDTSKRIKRLGESSQEIGNIIELINDIAEQTNILALNASIQASMAGEAGRGFAVVADEVQRLAERSTNATKQIEVLVRTIQADTNEAVVSMERSTTDVVGGALLAENAGAALDEIEQVSNQIANLVQNISGSARQQASSAADVTRRTSRLKEIGDQTAHATTATAASISKLSILASQLRQTVAGFTLPSASLENTALAGPGIEAPNSLLEGKAAG